MSSKQHYCRTADGEINSPELFLPTSLCFNGTRTLWTKQSYALFSGTQTPKEVPPNWRTSKPREIQLPARMQALKQQKQPPPHAVHYINEFQDALQMVRAWYKTQPTNGTMENQIKNWIQACELLTESQHFIKQQHWRVPTFQPWYHFDTYMCLEQYFYIKHRIAIPSEHIKLGNNETLPKKRLKCGKKHASMSSREISPQSPKCL
jgi:hypothetical protein